MSTVFLPGAYSQNVSSGGTPNPQVPFVVPALVGVSLGKLTTVASEAVTRGGSANTADTLAHTPVKRIISASLTNGGNPDFLLGTDYLMTGNTIDWSPAARLSPPAADTPTIAATTGGSFPSSTTYYYQITAKLGSGETIGSNIVSVAATAGVGGNGVTVSVKWGTVPNATSYRVFRSTNANMSASTLQGTTTAPTTSLIDTGAAGSSTAVPVSNTTENEPATGSTYYVSYEYWDTSNAYAKPKRYTSLSDVFADHGIGSQASIMAEMAMSTQGRGNGAPAVWISGAADDTTSFQNAIDAYQNVRGEVLLMVVGKKNSGVDTWLKNHLTQMNSTEAKRERMAIMFSLAGSVVGAAGSAGTILYDAAQSARKDIVHVVPDSGGAKGFIQQTDGTYLDAAMNPEYIAAGLAGLAASLPDSAEPWTRKTFTNLTSMTGAAEYSDIQNKALRDGGVTVVDYLSGQWRILDGRTTYTGGQQEWRFPSTTATDKVVSMIWRNIIDPADTSVGASGSLIGQKITDGLIEQVYNRTLVALDYCLAQGLIRDYTRTSITVQQDISDKSKINVAFEYTAIFPANVILANISFKPTA